MLFNNVIATAILLLSSTSLVSGLIGGKNWHHVHEKHGPKNMKRAYFPKPAQHVKTVTTPTGVKIRYKEPGKEGVCETTPGVNSYSGYIDISPTIHVFFYFFESRSRPHEDPLTVWLNGGPGSDSLIGLFQELGPCRITPNLTSVLNPYSWNDVSNMLFLSQPVGTGFSYQRYGNGSVTDNYSGTFLNSTYAKPDGTYPEVIPNESGKIDTTELAAVAAWHILQGFLSGHKQLGAVIGSSKEFNLFTESYGGHYGPAFFDYFYKQNQKIQSGEMKGFPLNMNSLGIGNGIISEYIQAPWYPEFAVNNTYGIRAYNDSVYEYARFAAYWPNGCLAQIELCEYAAMGPPNGLKNVSNGQVITSVASERFTVDALCQEAQDMCRDNVEYPYYYFSHRGTYDIRHPSNDPTPPEYFTEYLNQGYVQDALGVSVNYTESSGPVYFAFQNAGDQVYPNFLAELEQLLSFGVRVSLYYGDADYICNWFGGQAVSLAIKYANSKEFAAAGYTPLLWGGKEYGEVREYGNFSFARVYGSGHEVPYYQPGPSLAIFNRTINLVDIATGTKKITPDLSSNGTSQATHTQKSPQLASSTGVAHSTWASALVASYASVDNKPFPSSATVA